MKLEDSLIMGDDLSTIPKKEPENFIKSSVEDLVPIPSESEDTSDSDKECDFHFFMTFSNPLFDANDDFTSSDDESLPEDKGEPYLASDTKASFKSFVWELIMIMLQLKALY
ncbi:hypothetical protein Tco_0143549 [Tanacetum coccineum]